MAIDADMQRQYDEYLKNHIKNVEIGFTWMAEKLPHLFAEYDSDSLMNLIADHDKSKWSDEEYTAYCEYFYGEKTEDVKSAFDLAWLHHQHNNPHHWQHWLLREDDGGIKALEMPKQYILEMIADWWAFSWAKDNLNEIFSWYEQNKSKMVLHQHTMQFVETILSQLELKIAEVSANGD